MIGAGLVARKAREKGLNRKPWVKDVAGTGIAGGLALSRGGGPPGGSGRHRVQPRGLTAGQPHAVGNSGPLGEEISKCINDNDIIATSVLSGNRNFEGRISPDVRANYLASPPLVVAYALVGDKNVDITHRAAGTGPERQRRLPQGHLAHVAGGGRTGREDGDARGVPGEICGRLQGRRQVAGRGGSRAGDLRLAADPRPTCRTRRISRIWTPKPGQIEDIVGARVLAVLGDMITTDHISPAGSFKESSPAGQYLKERQVPVREFNSYGSRRGNHEIMMRGTFANIHRIKERDAFGRRGWLYQGPGRRPDVDLRCRDGLAAEGRAARRVRRGNNTGPDRRATGPRRGTALLGVKAVHRRELRAHPPLQPRRHGRSFRSSSPAATQRGSLGLTVRGAGDDRGPLGDVKPLQEVPATIVMEDGTEEDGDAQVAGSIPKSRSTISRTAASCITFCAILRQPRSPPR